MVLILVIFIFIIKIYKQNILLSFKKTEIKTKII